MDKNKTEGFESYPKPSLADEQFSHQDEFVTQKPNEKAPVSDVASESGEDEPKVKDQK